MLKSGLSIGADPDALRRVEQLVRTRGDAQRGKALFLNADRSACVTCHRLEGVGGRIGPDLTGLHKAATVGKLIESIVDPSREIKEGFEQHVVRTKSGQTYAGLRISSDANATVLRDAQGKDVTIPAGDVDKQAASKTSLMPDGAYSLLSLDELADLVAFLADGKAQESLRTCPVE